jgi:mannose-6-phosphate isomerase-like protein (cupin superfamily)
MKKESAPKEHVFNIKNVANFSPEGYEDAFVSRMLIDNESVGSEKLGMNYFALKPGKKTDQGSHPAPFDEVYYGLRGHGIVYLGESQNAYEIEPDSVVFIPHNTLHYVVNNSPVELEMITIMPGPLKEGVNSIYDERKKKWGRSFIPSDS